MTELLSPSDLMRKNRPYLFSDSSTEGAYILSESEFRHHLDSLTERNQHQDFEVFARKISEREIAPNLRPQTGPEGGGDGKVDTETFPVSMEISDRWFFGMPGSESERWGFAFSAKKSWPSKVRSDVKGMVETGRAYERIFFVTSRAARSKDRLRIEDELTQEYGVKVTIHDKSWLVDRVFENHHHDLAYKYLKVGRFDENSFVIGPRDLEREQELEEIEERLSRSGHSTAENRQSVVDALRAAKLSRMLEKPLIQTFGRFERAARLANRFGTDRQKMFALYERAWTGHWWFDEVETLNETYEQIEELAFADGNASDISQISNLIAILAPFAAASSDNEVFYDYRNRSARLKDKIDEISQDLSRPNNALYGKALCHLLDLTLAAKDRDANKLDAVWTGLAEVVDEARGLGEFPAELIDQVTAALQPLAPNSDAFDDLVLRLAEFMGERAKEGKAGQLLLARGKQKLDAKEPVAAICWLGKASVYLMKEEYAEEQFETLYSLTIAYKSAGLLWAARATSLSALVRIVELSDGCYGPRSELVPAATLFVMISIQLGRVADALQVILWLRGMKEVLQLTEQAQESLDRRFAEFDQILMCFFTNLSKSDLRQLEAAPDILEQLQLFSSRMALMVLLGHYDTLKTDGSIPETVQASELIDFVEIASVQPAARDLPNKLLMYNAEIFEFTTTVLGIQIEFVAGTSEQEHLLCEAHIGALESFLATSLENGVYPHTSKLVVTVRSDIELREPSISFDASEMEVSVRWPASLDVTDVTVNAELCEHLVTYCAIVVDATTIVSRAGADSFEKQLVDDLLIQRSVSFSNACIGNHRLFNTCASTLNVLQHLVERKYELKDCAPMLKRGEYLNTEQEENNDFTHPEKIVQSHKGYTVQSIINIHLWNRAQWNGVMFADFGPDHPPALALIFRNEEAAKSIFSGWNELLGNVDENDEIRLSMIRGVDANAPAHYRAVISKNIDFESDQISSSQKHMQAARMLTMEPSSNKNLERFLKDYQAKGCFWLTAAVQSGDVPPELIRKCSVLKRKLSVRDAWQIGIDDLDCVGIWPEDNILVPAEVNNPPCDEVIKFKRQMSVG